LTYILEDVKARSELAFQWLYEEYSFVQGFNRSASLLRKDDASLGEDSYNKLLCGLVTSLLEHADNSKEKDT
jgi:hypothetical protein